MKSFDAFKVTLAETITWCTERIQPDDPKNSLRSTDIRPPGLRICDRLRLSFGKIVNTVSKERRQYINAVSRDGQEVFKDLAGGRLLLCTSVTESIPDGVVSNMSKGFYDEDDLPPWDTWIYYLDAGKEYLISWVPPEWIQLANVGVEIHFLDCMRWEEMSGIELLFNIQNA